MTDQIKFTADKRELVAGLAWAVKGIGTRPVVPVLAGMRLEVSAGTVTLAGFDYDMAARSHVPADDTTAGTVLVIGHQLLTAVKGLPGGKGATVTATVTGERLTVSAGNVTATAEILPMDDYPELPAMPDAAGVVASGDFADAVVRVARAAGRDDTLPVLTAVNLVTSADGITLTATDRYRAAFDHVSWTPADLAAAQEYPWNLSVPAKAAVMFAKAAGKGGKVTLHISEAQLGSKENGHVSIPPRLGLSDGTRELIMRTVDGDYPDMSKRLPSEIHGSADADAASLAAAVKRAAGALERNMPVCLHVQRDGITVTAHRDGQEASRETVTGSCESDMTEDGRQVSGWRAAYNPEYLASMLAGVTGTVRLAWSGRLKPMHVAQADTAGGFRAIVMPVRVPF